MEKSESIFVATQHSRPCVVEITNGQCNVKTFELSMSKRHRIVMLINLSAIGFVPAMTVWCATQINTPTGIAASLAFGIAALVCGIGKTICDFSNWLFTMNKMQEKVGEWYLEDITNICNDFIKAGCKVAAEEVAKVLEKNNKTDGVGESQEKSAE